MTTFPGDQEEPTAAAVRRSSRRVASRGAECLDTPALAALAEGSAVEEERHDAALHLSTCAFCRTELADIVRLMNDDSVNAELGKLALRRPLRRRRTLAWAGAALAAATIAFAVVRTESFHRDPPGGSFRDETITLTSAPRIIAPVGERPAEPAFRWSSVPRADLYRLTLFDVEGAVMWHVETKDTTTTVGVPNDLTRGVRYLWKVEARTDFDRWVGTELMEFRCASCKGAIQ